MKKNQGYEVEKYIKKLFKGFYHPEEYIDFHTKNCFYEVKSCKLLIESFNRNDKRKFINKPHKRVKSHHLGRFVIKKKNHISLRLEADKENKCAKYIFVIVIGKKKVWKVYTWENVEKIILNKKTEQIRLTIKEVFRL